MSDPEPHLIWHLADRGHHDQAEARVRRVLAAQPENDWALRMLSFLLLEQDRVEEALQAAQTACRVAPAEPLCWIRLANVYRRMLRLSEAVIASERAVSRAPDLYLAYESLATAAISRVEPHRSEKLHDPAAALRAADEALRFGSPSSPMHTIRGLALVALGRPREAEEAYRRALALNPDAAAPLNNLAWLQLRRRPLHSARLFAQVTRLSPQSRDARENLALTIHAWMLRLIWIQLSVGVALILMHRLAPGLRISVLAGLYLFCVIGTVALVRALPRGSLRALWSTYPTKRRSGACRLSLAAATVVALAVVDGPLWFLAVIVWAVQIVVEWRVDFFGYQGPLRVWDSRARRRASGLGGSDSSTLNG